MYTIEFETIIRDGVVNIPEKYSQLKNARARIVVLYDSAPEDSPDAEVPVEIDFSQIKAPSLTHHDGVEYQRSMRDEW